MSDITGIRSNGFNYTATYDPDVTGSVEWMATFRLVDVYWGVRRGYFSQVETLTQADLFWAVMADIEEPLVGTH
ncbi:MULTISPECIES: hypothetical protein [Dyella]|uniref:hypothetical protein n=1 Tax=Dyella TaxID=231454 RepID=UPI0018EE3902|nr:MULTISPECIES: hypothetical protein [Dyella]MDR3446721.1 hypothetical protein [Dyella sp.]ULU23427.1 hypothetical protein DYST_00323 [Dyella terrae]